MIVAAAAKADLRDIWNFSARRWDREQADKYISLIDGLMQQAAAGTLQCRELDFVSPGLFKARALKHFLYFRKVADGIRVVRILHERMDETLHIP